MPHDPVTTRQDVVEGDTGCHDMVVLSKYEAPCNPDGSVADDAHKQYDEFVANRAMSLLMATHPGYPWCVVSDAKHHILKISIPILMGVCHWYVINLRQTELSKGAVIVAGGEILERYRLGRSKFNLGAFLGARAQHSALVVPRRPVPV
jgi:hypothetical protein